MEVSYTLIRLLQEFKDIESRDAELWLERIGVTYTNGNGAKVSLIPALPEIWIRSGRASLGCHVQGRTWSLNEQNDLALEIIGHG